MTPTQPRTRRSDREIAEERLGVATRKVEKLEGDEKRLGDELEAVRRDLAAARSRRDYLAKDPALPQTGDTAEDPPDETTAPQSVPDTQVADDEPFEVDDDTIEATR